VNEESNQRPKIASGILFIRTQDKERKKEKEKRV
jgi:hypothetical protein